MTVLYFGPDHATKELFNQHLVESPPQFISIDTETISLKERLPIGFAIAVSPSEAWYFKVYPEPDPEIAMLKPLLANPNIKKIMHNCMFDVRVMALALPYQMDDSNIADTNVMARLLGKAETKLGILAEEVGLKAQDAPSILLEYNAKSMLEIPPEALAAKCANDAKVALALFYEYLPQIDLDYFKVEMAVIPILIDMSQRGLKIDQDSRAVEETRLETDKAYYKSVCAEEDFNPGSGQQTGYVLAKRGNFLPFTKSRRQLKTDEDTLQFVDDPLATVVLGYKKANSLLTKYIYPLRGLDRIYTEYGLDTVVGRTNSSNFNMQNIPEHLRQIFVPDSGTYTTGDFSQEHLRILMHFSGDKQMERVYNEGEMGGDIHAYYAKKKGLPRYIAKVINYAIPYGATPFVIRAQTKIRDIRKCSQYLDEWFDTFRDAAAWIRGAKEYGLQHHKSLPTLFGRQIAIPDELTKYGKLDLEAMGRKAVNYPILGSDGEVMKRALIICAAHGLPLAVQVHDSITCDGDIEFPVEQLESIAPVRIPFMVEKSPRWK
jgi:DNA polymerase I